MSVAYVDSSALIAIIFDEPGASGLARHLNACTRLVSSNLLEAEARAAFARENLVFQERSLAGIDWVLPDRPLTGELVSVLEAGYLRGADLWHLATALYVSPQPGALSVATLDARQALVATALGFSVMGEPRHP